MTKWFAYIVLVLIFAPCMLSAETGKPVPFHNALYHLHTSNLWLPADTNKKTRAQDDDDKNKIKEISKAKRQSKPEKLDDSDNDKPRKRKRERPEGMERPPEIPRRNGN